MSLGNDHTVCTDALVAAMREKLDEYDPPAGDNVDLPSVRRNFEGIGDGLYAVLTTRVETVSQAAQDSAFWAWVNTVTLYLNALGTWQQGVRQAAQSWTPTDAGGQQLRTALLALVPGTPPGPAPTRLTGRLT